MIIPVLRKHVFELTMLIYLLNKKLITIRRVLAVRFVVMWTRT